MLENALRDTASWLATKWSSSTVFQVLAWVITNSKVKNLNQMENYHQHAHKMLCNACTWHELGDLTFFGPWTNWHELSQNGLRLVTDVWQDWFHTFITHMTTDNIVLWLSIVAWSYSKTQILLETWRTQTQPQEESYVSLEAHQLNVQETDVSIQTFHRIWNNFVGSWTASGWITCCRPLGRRNWSVKFNEQQKVNLISS